MPFNWRNWIYRKYQRVRLSWYRQRILYYYKHHPSQLFDASTAEALEFLKHNPFCGLPYSFSKKYDPAQVRVHHDSEINLHYCNHEGKKLYFKRGLHPDQIRYLYTNLLMEQDPLSAHRYLSGDFRTNEDSVVLDAGAAEGNFSLSVVDQVRMLMIVDPDPDWIEALQATFKPWDTKVRFITSKIGNQVTKSEITIDEIVRKYQRPDFIKIDVDGAEDALLDGAVGLLTDNRPLRVALCTYHKAGDADKYKILLQKLDFDTTFSDGYMVYVSRRGLEFPYLRKGLIRAKKNRRTSLSKNSEFFPDKI